MRFNPKSKSQSCDDSIECVACLVETFSGSISTCAHHYKSLSSMKVRGMNYVAVAPILEVWCCNSHYNTSYQQLIALVHYSRYNKHLEE